jgi:C-terminal processing protease CtpA/Prc
MFSRDDEEAIRRGIAGGTVAPVTDSIMRIEPLEALLQRMNITAMPVQDGMQTTSVAVVSDVIARYGMRLRAHRGGVIVDYVMVNSRAYRIGLCVGDQIVTMNRVPVGADVDGAYTVLNAARYDVVQLDVKRGQRQFLIKVEGTQRSLQLVTVVRDGRIGYIGLPVISMQSVRDARDSIREMDRDGIAALIIDVRGTNVGSVAAAAELVSYFVKGGIFRGIRPMIAVDMITRGAAEVLAYELQRSDDATIVGVPSAGAMARQLTIPTTTAVRYAFTQAYDREEPQRRVQPDHAMPILGVDLDAVRTAAARAGDITVHRTSLWHSTDIDGRHIEELRRRLPTAYQRVDDSVLAEAVYGSAARYFQLESVVRMLRGVTER